MNPDVQVEQARLLLRQAPSSIAGGGMVAITTLIIFWDPTLPLKIGGWFSAFLIVSSLRLLIWHRHRNQPSAQSLLLFKERLNALLALSGIIWGYGMWAIFPVDNALLTGVLVAIYSILISGAIGALAPSAKSYLIYISPIALSVASVLIVFAPEVPIYIPMGFILFTGICYFYTRTMEQTIIESIELRFENTALITELKRREVRLSRAAEIAKEANDEKSRFLAVASHDLLQLMHALELFMRALTKETNPGRSTNLVSKASESTKLLSGMLSSLMDQSRLETNKVEPNWETVDLKDTLSSVLTELQTVANTKGLALETRLEMLSITTDAQLFQRIAINLIGNALKYTKQGRVSIKLEESEDDVVLTVTDTGIGIPEEELENILKEYYQVENRTSSGLGLGLSIVQRLNQLLGFDMTITSEVDCGTTVELRMNRNTIAQNVSNHL